MVSAEIKEKMKVDGLPRLMLIDKNGNIAIMRGAIKEVEKMIK